VSVVTPTLSAFNYGYISPRLRGRADLDFFNQACDYMQNYISTPQGEASLRYGSVFVSRTRNNAVARLIPFLYNTEQAYQLEVTDQYIRFYKDHGLVTFAPKNITAITQAAAAQVTIAGHGLLVGQPLFLSGIGGMTRLNGREAAVASVVDANNITININTTSFSAYTSGGTVAQIYELASPYTEAQLFEIDYTQTNDTMYIVHKDHQPRKLQRAGSHTAWTLATFAYQGNPFGTTLTATQAITGITQANPAVITYTGADTFSNGDTVAIAGVLGMTQINGVNVTVQNVNTTANTFECAGLDATAFSAYTSGGTVAKYTAFSWPSVVSLFEGRIIYAASDAYPTTLFFSNAGFLETFHYGTKDGDAIRYTIRADQANRIRWIAGAEEYMAIGTSGSEFRLTGGGDNGVIAPLNISIKPSSYNGVASTRPIRLDNYILYIQRNGRTVRSFEYNALQDGYSSPDRTLLADHIGKSKFKQISYTTGTPNIIWMVRNDGKMAGLTFDPAQQVVAWHLHNTQGLYLSLSTIPEASDDDELWQVAERTINGQVCRYVEYVPNVPDIPVKEDYYTAAEQADKSQFLTDLWNVQKTLNYMDSSLSYDGRDLATVNITVTGDLTSGSAVTLTASGAFFTAAMATDKRRLQTADGGQIIITGYTSATIATGQVLYDLESATLAAGTWYYMVTTISGLNHLEGASVSILADGGTNTPQVVTNGTVTLDEYSGYVIIGLGYVGIGKSQSIEGGGDNGSAHTKNRNIDELTVRLRASIGTKFGTNLYNLEAPAYRQTFEIAGRPPRLLSEPLTMNLPDTWATDKAIVWVHDTPTPSNIQHLMFRMTTND
jgi:hypothetical protein